MLIKKKQAFNVFPALNISLLSLNDDINLLSCNMQQVDEKSYLKQTKLENVYFYTGLKQYYKINLKKDILFDYDIENKKNLVYLNKQFYKKNNFISGDNLIPSDSSYKFSKRRFLLNLNTDKSLKTKEFVALRFTDLIINLNEELLYSLIFKLNKLKKMPSRKLHFYLLGKPKLKKKKKFFYSPGTVYSFMGIQGVYLKSLLSVLPNYYIPNPLALKRKTKHLFVQQIYFTKNVLNFTFFFNKLLPLLFNKSIKTASLGLFQNYFKIFLKEFISIKHALYFLFNKHMKFVTPKGKKRAKKILVGFLKICYFLFQKTNKVFKLIFQSLFNWHRFQLKTYNTLKSSRLQFNFSSITTNYKLNFLVTNLKVSNLYFSCFKTGHLNKNHLITLSKNKVKKNYYYEDNISSERYRKTLFSRVNSVSVKRNNIMRALMYFESDHHRKVYNKPVKNTKITKKGIKIINEKKPKKRKLRFQLQIEKDKNARIRKQKYDKAKATTATAKVAKTRRRKGVSIKIR